MNAPVTKPPVTKLHGVAEWADIPAAEVADLAAAIFRAAGCGRSIAREIADHLVDSNLCGVESHGIMRAMQYVEQFEAGYMRADAKPEARTMSRGGTEIDGNGGIGIPAMRLAVERGVAMAQENGIAAVSVRNAGHTGRIGAFSERAADAGCLSIIIGGGNRKVWRQVAPHGGRKALLPTNPYSIAVPGGECGPMVLDFATSKIAGGWVYAAKSAGAKLPPESAIDANGEPTVEPDDYLEGGALLPAAGPKGFALGLAAELIAEAMLGPATTELNWLMITLDARRYRGAEDIRAVAEEILAEVRDCPPAAGFDRVQVPGERERDLREAANGRVVLAKPTWDQIVALGRRLGVD